MQNQELDSGLSVYLLPVHLRITLFDVQGEAIPGRHKKKPNDKMSLRDYSVPSASSLVSFPASNVSL